MGEDTDNLSERDLAQILLNWHFTSNIEQEAELTHILTERLLNLERLVAKLAENQSIITANQKRIIDYLELESEADNG